ncbi:nitroreductase [Rhodococcus qingshengii]|uniref:nitroreductase n=1 Tax=Rhodococcus qingshengii TaxID=334542 RepID=UPI0036DF37FE
MTPSTVTPATTGALRALQENRRSCRAFTSEPVPHDTLVDIVDAARLAPSWCNTQPWHVHITEGIATEMFRAGLRDHIGVAPRQEPDIAFPASYEGVYGERRRESGWQLYESLGIAQGDRVASGKQTLRNFDLFDAPHLALVTTDRTLGTYGVLDCGIFVANLLLAAHSRGVATIAQAALASQAPFIREFFAIPDDRDVLLGISLGFSDDTHPANTFRTNRQPVSDVVSWKNS